MNTLGTLIGFGFAFLLFSTCLGWARGGRKGVKKIHTAELKGLRNIGRIILRHALKLFTKILARLTP